jgi:GMP synthase-like glutamine amidotransferase
MAAPKRVLILQHILENPAGRVGSILDEYEIFYHLIHVGRDHLPDPTRYHAIIVLGGSQHLYDKRRFTYTIPEEAYLHRAVKDGIPYLGMCLGGQLLANTFQATIQKLPKVYAGFLHVHFTEAGKEDPLYQGLPGYQQAFQWHEDCFLLPEGAIEIARETSGFNQGFRYGEKAYGLQYHIELTEEILDTWLHDPSMKKEFIDVYGIEAYKKTEKEAIELYPTYARHSTIMLQNFFKLSELI